MILFLILFLLYLLIGTIVPYLHHKKVKGLSPSDVKMSDFLSEKGEGVRLRYIYDNTDALIVRLRMLEEAKEQVLLSTFDFNDDNSGKDMMAAMLAAADRGVKVKILVDGLSAFMDIPRSDYFKALVSHSNVEIKVYAPINILKPWAWQVRLHDKYIVVDQGMYLLGGRNTTDLFLGDYVDHQNFDGDLFVEKGKESLDQSVGQLEAYFYSVWDLSSCKEYKYQKKNRAVQKTQEELKKHYQSLENRYPEAYDDQTWERENMYRANKVSLLSNPIEPVNKEPILWFQLVQLMKEGHDILIQSPYVICNQTMYQDLASLVRNGSELCIITNDPNSGANVAGTSDYHWAKGDILDTGARVFEFSGEHSSHTKAILIDRQISIVGSFNVDMRSAYLDTELMLVVDSPELNATLWEGARGDMEQSKEYLSNGNYIYGVNYQEPETSGLKRSFSKTLGFLLRPFRHLL